MQCSPLLKFAGRKLLPALLLAALTACVTRSAVGENVPPDEPRSSAPTLKLLTLGTYFCIPPVRRPASNEAPSTVPFSIDFPEESSRIAPEIGSQFGVAVRVHSHGADIEVPLRIVWRVPEPGIPDPANGSLRTVFAIDATCAVDTICIFDREFIETKDMLPGTWSFEAWNHSRLLLRQEFEVSRTTDLYAR